LVFGKEKAPAIESSKSIPYCNIGSILMIQSRGFLKAKNPILEVICVYQQSILIIDFEQVLKAKNPIFEVVCVYS
jgi:hypothetical protein